MLSSLAEVSQQVEARTAGIVSHAGAAFPGAHGLSRLSSCVIGPSPWPDFLCFFNFFNFFYFET